MFFTKDIEKLLLKILNILVFFENNKNFSWKFKCLEIELYYRDII
mgnify:CR=1 FL=1